MGSRDLDRREERRANSSPAGANAGFDGRTKQCNRRRERLPAALLDTSPNSLWSDGMPRLTAERRRANRLNRIETAVFLLCVLALLGVVVLFAQL